MKNKKKGFTLVELIVVLAILAILAAMLVPALTGYIDKANKQKVVAECRQVVMAAQTETSTLYASQNGGSLATYVDTDNAVANKIKTLSETTGTFAITFTADGKVKSVNYNNSGWVITYTDGSYSDPVKQTDTNKVTGYSYTKATS